MDNINKMIGFSFCAQNSSHNSYLIMLTWHWHCWRLSYL